MIARLKTRLFPTTARRDGLMIEDLLGVVALFALLFASLALPASA